MYHFVTVTPHASKQIIFFNLIYLK